MIGQLFEHSTSGFDKSHSRNKEIEREILEHKGRAVYLTQTYGHYNVA
jgi:hypothetical protein